MRAVRGVILAILMLSFGGALAGCDTLEDFSLFDTKKKLPGERKAVFPEGVPGVTQGIPPELMKGYQEPAQPVDPAAAAAQAAAQEKAEKAEPKPAPKPKPRVVARPKPTPAAQQSQQPPQQGQAPAQQQQQPQAPWPSQQPQPSWPQQQAQPQQPAWPTAR
jgi:hypothetical protein